MLDAGPHQPPQRIDGSLQLGVFQGSEGAPGIDGRSEATLALVDVSNARDQALVQQCLSHGAILAGASKGRDPGRSLEGRIHQIGAQRREPRIGSQLAFGSQIKTGAAELCGLDAAIGREHHPRGAQGSAPLRPGGSHLPRAVHAEVGVKDETGLEMNQQVLAPGLDPFHAAGAKLFEPGGVTAKRASGAGDGYTGHGPSRKRCLKAPRGAVDRVTLRHRVGEANKPS